MNVSQTINCFCFIMSGHEPHTAYNYKLLKAF